MSMSRMQRAMKVVISIAFSAVEPGIRIFSLKGSMRSRCKARKAVIVLLATPRKPTVIERFGPVSNQSQIRSCCLVGSSARLSSLSR